MLNKRLLVLPAAISLVFFGFLSAASSAFAVGPGIELRGSAQGGGEPYAGLIFDAAGNLYGTTYQGGTYKEGTVFQLTPNGRGVWTEKVLHSFGKGNDGRRPYASLIFDTTGNLYGTTQMGGAHSSACSDYGCGTIFELTPRANGKWTEKVLHSFNENGKDGYFPYASLTLDSTGSLYGTTQMGGAHGTACSGYGCGTVFQLAPGVTGKWTEKVLHSFNNNGQDGYYTQASLVFDPAGNLYGTTVGGGDHLNSCGGCGTVFQLTPSANGKWTETVLYDFTGGQDGESPVAGLVFDATGNLYGTSGFGVVFRLSRGEGGKWAETTLYSLGAYTYPSLVFDAVGNLYGTTLRNGVHAKGTVFQLTAGENGTWTENALYSFCSSQSCTDGAWPFAGVIFDSSGNLYGTTFYGGADVSGCDGLGCGTVFQLSPGENGTWTETVLHSFGKSRLFGR